MAERERVLTSKNLLTRVHLEEAGHHLHIDPSSRSEVAENIISFFNQHEGAL